MSKQDSTDIIERMEPLEERLGVRLQALSAYIDTDPEDVEVVLNGELALRHGNKLGEDISLVVAGYGSDGRVLGTTEHYVDHETFFHIETFSILFYLPSRPTRLRIYPKK